MLRANCLAVDARSNFLERTPAALQILSLSEGRGHALDRTAERASSPEHVDAAVRIGRWFAQGRCRNLEGTLCERSSLWVKLVADQ